MTHTEPLHLLILAASWTLFGISHSLLAGSTLERAFGRNGRLIFNGVAVVMMAVPIAILAFLPAIPLWQEPDSLRWTRYAVSLIAMLAFIRTLKFYSLPAFLGLKIETWPLTFSPWHCWVRHPWYFLLLVLIWAQTMTEAWLVSALCMTIYLVFGSRIEEKRILRHHPDSYADYCRIVPGLIPWRGRALDEATRLRPESQALTESHSRPSNVGSR